MTEFDRLGLKAVIFDMDGLLFDTEAVYLEAWPHAGRALGITIAIKDIKDTVGRPPWDYEDFFRTRYGPAFCMIKALDAIREYVTDKFETYGIPLKPGAREVLEFLHQKGIPTAMGTSNRSNIVAAYLKATEMTHYFNPIVTGDMVNEAKPAPDIYLKAAKDLGLRPEQCLVLEDSPIGAEAACRAGCRTVIVPDLVQPDDVIRSKVWRVFETLGDVQKTLFAPQ
ncbi:MAG: HAD family phosphatase [Oscillospiraceae bacterium]|nr:HAD family phosphatase [Oscillospiraceae bacterium]